MRLLKYGAVLLFLMSLWGCSKGNDVVPAGAAIDPATNKHQDGMAVSVTGGTHVGAYYENPAYCVQCHGETADLAGGITKVSCSTASRSGISCHAGKWPHGTGYEAFNLHGNTARSAATGFIGMAYCKNCHGSDYKGASGVGVSCIGCHNRATGSNAPHAANWARYLANANSLNHSRVDASNAPACAQCHTGKANLSAAGKIKVAAFTTPGSGGCFNNSLCHNQAGHAPYTDVTHRPDARADVVCGLACHATPATATSNPRFNVPITTSNGVPMANGCETCHTRPGLAHPYIWLPNRVGGGTTTHGMNGTTGLPGNVLGACVICHNVTVAGAKFGVPSCMSGASGVPGLNPAIICHFTSPVTGTNATAGCNSCHGGLPAGPAGVSIPNTANAHPKHTALTNVTCNTCHDGLGSGNQKHADGTANVVFLATQAGATAAYTAVTKTCANISCHSGYTPPAWTVTNCTGCHGTPPDGTNLPNRANAHAKHNFACDTCHFGLGSGKPLHANGTPNIVFSSPAGATAAYTAATKTCANILCHGGNPTPAWTATNVAGCTMCHTSPPSTNNHMSHWNVIPAITCEACHTGDGPGVTAVHPDAVVVKGFPAQFNDGGASYAAGSCSNVSCHGGKPTPAWTGAAIPNYVYDPTGTNCTLNCHTVRNPAVQYIDVFSGDNQTFGTDLHDAHVNFIGSFCTDCHGLQADKLPLSHFSALSNGKRLLVPGSAAGTMGGTGTQINSYTYDAVTPGSCNSNCHEPRNWFR